VSGIQTATRSQTNSFTEARLRAVMPEVGADFTNMAGAAIISFATAQRWSEELTFVLQKQAARGFQVQLRCPGRATIALDYRVSSDGTVRESGQAGGIDYYALPEGTTASLFVDLDDSSRNIMEVRLYTQQRGWGTGTAVAGDPVRDRVYSKEGYGFVRGKIGPWP
jgi:Bacterial HORMA domain family 1